MAISRDNRSFIEIGEIIMENKENIQKAFNNFNNKITLGGSKEII